MNHAEIEDRLCALLGRIIDEDPAAIDRKVPLLRGGLELDSLSAAEFISIVEAEYSVDILEEDLTLSSLESLVALAGFIVARVGG